MPESFPLVIKPGWSRPSFAIPPPSKRSTSRTPGDSNGSRSSVWGAARGSPTATTSSLRVPRGSARASSYRPSSSAPVGEALPRATSGCRACCTRSRSAAANGSYTRLLTRLAKLDLLAIDDWLLAPLRDAERRDLAEVIEDRAERASTLIASQLPVPDWHAVIGDPNQADAICDRLLHDAHRIELTGPSLRRTKTAPKTSTKAQT